MLTTLSSIPCPNVCAYPYVSDIVGPTGALVPEPTVAIKGVTTPDSLPEISSVAEFVHRMNDHPSNYEHWGESEKREFEEWWRTSPSDATQWYRQKWQHGSLSMYNDIKQEMGDSAPLLVVLGPISGEALAAEQKEEYRRSNALPLYGCTRVSQTAPGEHILNPGLIEGRSQESPANQRQQYLFDALWNISGGSDLYASERFTVKEPSGTSLEVERYRDAFTSSIRDMLKGYVTRLGEMYPDINPDLDFKWMDQEQGRLAAEMTEAESLTSLFGPIPAPSFAHTVDSAERTAATTTQT